MKIALIVPGGVDRSGEYRVIPAILALITRLARRHELHVFALRQEAEPATWELAGARIHNIGVPHTFGRGLRMLLTEHRREPFAFVQAIWSGGCGQLAVAAARLAGTPSAIHLTGGEIVAFPAINYGGRRHLTGRVREYVLLRAATAVTATSQPTVDALGALGVRATRLPLGVDLERWPRLPPRRRPDREPARLLHVATLNGVKDQPTLLSALALLKSSGRAFHLDVVGDDILDGRIQRLAVELGLAAQVTFHGFLTQSALRPLVEQAALLLLSSLHEAGPYVLLEAAVAGVPAIGTHVGHFAEWAPDAALAVPVGNSAALARELVRVLDDEALRLGLAHNAQACALAEDADCTARAFDRQFHRLTGGLVAATR